MSTSAARLSRRSLCASVVLALSLTCLGLAFWAPTTSMAGMAGMAGMGGSSATGAPDAVPTVAVLHAVSGQSAGAVVDAVQEVAPLAASAGSTPVLSMCEGGCVSELGAVCAVALGLMVISGVALVLATRRNTFLGLLARVRLGPGPRRRHRSAWAVISPISLCVLRV